MLQYSEQVGPLIKVVRKMMLDFFNFCILYFMLTIMFALIGNINFLYEIKQYSGLFSSILSVIDTSLGNFDF